ncbi:MAG: hypothetical protein JW749_01080 [Sedimentisphaerales bacterium]|nr:hypothetical protein [Sedimentisphaerales bacterium]
MLNCPLLTILTFSIAGMSGLNQRLYRLFDTLRLGFSRHKRSSTGHISLAAPASPDACLRLSPYLHQEDARGESRRQASRHRQ